MYHFKGLLLGIALLLGGCASSNHIRGVSVFNRDTEIQKTLLKKTPLGTKYSEVLSDLQKRAKLPEYIQKTSDDEITVKLGYYCDPHTPIFYLRVDARYHFNHQRRLKGIIVERYHTPW